MLFHSQIRSSIQQLKLLVLQPTGLAIGLMAVWTGLAAIVTFLDLPIVQWLNLNMQTTFFQLRGPVKPPAEIVIVAMDEYTDNQAQFYQGDANPPAFVQWLKSAPWQRQAHATVIERLMRAGARGVMIDVLFLGDSSYGQEDDRQFQAVLQRFQGRIALAAEYVEDNSVGFGLTLATPTPNLQTNPPTAIGYVNFLESGDARIHDLPSRYATQVLQPLQMQVIPALSEVALQVAKLHYSPPKGESIYFYGPAGQTFQIISFWNVLDPQEWRRLQAQQTFKNKLVLIGPTAASLQDFAPTPFSESPLYPKRMPGVEIHAHAIATMLENKAIAQAIPDYGLRGLFVLVFVAGVAYLCWLPNTIWLRASASVGLITLWLGISYVSFISGQLILPVAIPVVAIGLNAITHFMIETMAQLLEKLRLRRTLERYVSPAIVQEILQQPEDYRSLLKGRKINAAVLFCDIRSFTTISEKMAGENKTEQLVEQLNVYLDAMVKAILSAGGTIDKFIGDAVMAEFGSPVSAGEKQDAMSAIYASLNMRRALVQLREQWKQSGNILFYNGIGINYGELIAGNIGSEQRLEYTVIGDTVNVASRVEGVTKDWGTDILITHNLYELVKDEVEVSYLGEHSLKGHGAKIPLYALVGLKGDDPQQYLKIRDELRQYVKWKKS